MAMNNPTVSAMTLANIMYLEDMTIDYIATYPDDVSTQLIQLVKIVELRSANETLGNTVNLVLGVNDQLRLDQFYESVKCGWTVNDWGLEDIEYYGGRR